MRLYSVYSEYLLNCTVKLRIGVDGACVYFVLAGVQGIQCIVKLRIGVVGGMCNLYWLGCNVCNVQ